MCREGDMDEDGELNMRKLEKVRDVDKVMSVMRAWKHDGVAVDVHVDSGWAKGPERKSTSGGMMMVNGTVVNHFAEVTGFTIAEHGGFRTHAIVTVPTGAGKPKRKREAVLMYKVENPTVVCQAQLQVQMGAPRSRRVSIKAVAADER